MPYKIFNFFINRTKKSERIALKFSSPIASNISNILTTVYSFILSNPLGHQSPYLIYICHLAAHLCGWLSFGIICRSIKSLDKGFNFFRISNLYIGQYTGCSHSIASSSTKHLFSCFYSYLIISGPFFNQFMQFSDSESSAVTLQLFTILIYAPH